MGVGAPLKWAALAEVGVHGNGYKILENDSVRSKPPADLMQPDLMISFPKKCEVQSVDWLLEPELLESQTICKVDSCVLPTIFLLSIPRGRTNCEDPAVQRG